MDQLTFRSVLNRRTMIVFLGAPLLLSILICIVNFSIWYVGAFVMVYCYLLTFLIAVPGFFLLWRRELTGVIASIIWGAFIVGASVCGFFIWLDNGRSLHKSDGSMLFFFIFAATAGIGALYGLIVWLLARPDQYMEPVI